MQKKMVIFKKGAERDNDFLPDVDVKSAGHPQKN